MWELSRCEIMLGRTTSYRALRGPQSGVSPRGGDVRSESESSPRRPVGCVGLTWRNGSRHRNARRAFAEPSASTTGLPREPAGLLVELVLVTWSG